MEALSFWNLLRSKTSQDAWTTSSVLVCDEGEFGRASREVDVTVVAGQSLVTHSPYFFGPRRCIIFFSLFEDVGSLIHIESFMYIRGRMFVCPLQFIVLLGTM